MERVLAILNKYNVTTYELATWLVSHLEVLQQDTEEGIEDYDLDRINSLFREMNKLNWQVTPKETIDRICTLGDGVRERLMELGFIE